MKVAITSTGTTLDAEVDPRFGRCSTFLIVETDDMTFEVVDNAGAARGGGAGILAAQTLAHRGVKTVLTGNCGPNAHQTLGAAGIDVIVGCTGKSSHVVARFVAGELSPSASPNVESHAGMGGGGR